MIDLLKSKPFVGVIAVLGVFILLLATFSLGTLVGQGKMRHMAGWCEGYGHPAGNGRQPVRRPLPFMEPVESGHGVFGRVISVSGTTLVVQAEQGLEQQVRVTSSTDIRMGRSKGVLTDITPEAEVAVFGSPADQGWVEAKLIRLLSTP